MSSKIKKLSLSNNKDNRNINALCLYCTGNANPKRNIVTNE